MEEYAYLPIPYGGIGSNRVGFIRKAVKNLLPHELEFIKETKGMRITTLSEQAILSAAVNKLFAANKTMEHSNVNT